MISKEQADLIVSSNPAFYKKEHSVSFCGSKPYTAVTYNYRLASATDFRTPIKYQPRISAFELRGLTFVQHPYGNPEAPLWHRHVQLQKFFNINETEGWMAKQLKKKKIEAVYNKLDGSLISFIPLLNLQFPSGLMFVPKTQNSFENDQTKLIWDTVFDHRRMEWKAPLDTFLRNMYALDLTPLFELVSPMNRVVVGYPKTELVLLQIRQGDGCLKPSELKFWAEEYGIPCAANYAELMPGASLQEYMDHLEPMRDSEGGVFLFEDGQMAKFKNPWYLALHRVFTNDVKKHNYLVEMTINGLIDEVLQACEGADELHAHVTEVAHRTRQVLLSEMVQAVSFLEQYKARRITSRGELFGKVRHLKTAGAIMSLAHQAELGIVDAVAVEEKIRAYVLKQCNKENKAKEFLGM